MNIGFVPPVPMEPALAGGHRAVNLWTAYFLGAPLEGAPLADAAPAAGETPWSQFLLSAPRDMGLEEVVFPSTGMPPAAVHALEALGASGFPLRTFRFPLLRNLEKTRASVSELCSAYGAGQGAVGALVEQWSHIRISVKRMDALQGRNAAYPSPHYLQTLARAMDPMGDLEGLRREVESRNLENPGLSRESWTHLALVGPPPRRPELWAALEELRAVVVYDEWGTECNALHPVRDLAALWDHCSLPFGLKPRQERLLKEFASRKVHGALWCAEGLADSLREESFFRGALPVPVHTVDNARSGPLEATEADSLARFVTRCARRRAGE